VPPSAWLDRTFRLRESGTTARTEVLGGTTTFPGGHGTAGPLAGVPLRRPVPGEGRRPMIDRRPRRGTGADPHGDVERRKVRTLMGQSLFGDLLRAGLTGPDSRSPRRRSRFREGLRSDAPGDRGPPAGGEPRRRPVRAPARPGTGPGSGRRIRSLSGAPRTRTLPGPHRNAGPRPRRRGPGVGRGDARRLCRSRRRSGSSSAAGSTAASTTWPASACAPSGRW
jgi:hypothetical protein